MTVFSAIRAVNACLSGILERRGVRRDARRLAAVLRGRVSDRESVRAAGAELFGDGESGSARLHAVLHEFDERSGKYGLVALHDGRGGFWIGGRQLAADLASLELRRKTSDMFDRLFGNGRG